MNTMYYNRFKINKKINVFSGRIKEINKHNCEILRL